MKSTYFEFSFTYFSHRPGYFYWESVLFPTTSMKWDNFSRFSDQYFLLQNHMTSRLYIWYIFIYVCMFYIVSFQTLQFHTKRIWENKTCFHYLSVRLQLLHSCEHPSLQWVGKFYILLPSRTCLGLSKKFLFMSPFNTLIEPRLIHILWSLHIQRHIRVYS